MIVEKINLGEIYQNSTKATLTYYYAKCSDLERIKQPTMVIFPGGGYCGCSSRESDPIALAYLLKGYNCFILNYTTLDKVEDTSKPLYPRPQLDALMAMDYIVKNADKYFVDLNNVFAIGFSAGSHLLGSYAFECKNPDLLNKLNLIYRKEYSFKGICLAYPVISLKKGITHEGSAHNLCGEDMNLRERLSIENRVTSDYPATYLWHTHNDQVVNVNNSIMMKEALDKAGVKNQMVIYPDGPHGLSLATKLVGDIEYKDVQPWVDNVDEFFKSID